MPGKISLSCIWTYFGLDRWRQVRIYFKTQKAALVHFGSMNLASKHTLFVSYKSLLIYFCTSIHLFWVYKVQRVDSPPCNLQHYTPVVKGNSKRELHPEFQVTLNYTTVTPLSWQQLDDIFRGRAIIIIYLPDPSFLKSKLYTRRPVCPTFHNPQAWWTYRLSALTSLCIYCTVHIYHH